MTMTAEKQATKAQVLSYARELHGKRVFVEYVPQAPTAEQHQKTRERLDTIKHELPFVIDESKTLRDAPQQLREAARFVVDVRGGDPSIDQLAKALEHAERLEAVLIERRELTEEQRVKSGSLCWKRCKVLVPTGIARRVLAWGDTWQECLNELQHKAGKDSPNG